MKIRTFSPLAFAVSLSCSLFHCAALANDITTEAGAISVLQSESSPQQKDAACVWLKRHGTAQSVPALAALLNDEQLSQSARYALESLPGPASEKALIAALAQTSGDLKAGIIHSLGVRADPRAIRALGELLTDTNGEIARASAVSLGDIATPAALKALERRLDASHSSTERAVVDGCLRCAQHELKGGHDKQAFAVYQKIYQRPGSEFFHVAAWRGMALASGDEGLDLIANAITNGPAPLRMEAIQLAHEVNIPGAARALAMLLPEVDSLTQVALIDALGQRDDPAAAPEIAILAKQAEPETRVAAVSALGTLGDDQDLPLLVEVASTAGDPAQTAARQALGLVHRGKPNATLLAMLSSEKPEAQVEIIRALSSRSATEATPQLMGLARNGDDTVRDAAFEALARLVDQPQLDALVQLVAQMTTDASRASAAGALSAACRHIQREHGTVDMTPVWMLLKNGSPAARAALMPVCSGVVDPQARDVLRASLADTDPAIHEAAISAVCDTIDPALLPDVEKIACESPDESARTLALEACVRIATQEDSIHIPEPERIQLFQAITPAASSAAEKRVVLSGLAAVPDDSALQLAKPMLSDVTVSNEAARAVIQICRRLPDAGTAAATLEDLADHVPGDALRQEAKAALKVVDTRAEYITSWQFAGPYRQAGQNFSGLFDIVFPPETANAQSVDWRVLPVNDDPNNPWVMDLLKAMGGEQEVAYARTSIHCAASQSAQLLINSDDGVKVWLNGEVVHANNVSRGLGTPPDRVKIKLKPGWNQLLLKVTQNNAGWGFCVRLTNPDGSRPKDVQYAANPSPTAM